MGIGVKINDYKRLWGKKNLTDSDYKAQLE